MYSKKVIAFLLMGLMSAPTFAKEIKLDWKYHHKYESGYNQDVLFKIIKVKTKRDKLIFDVVAHNKHKSSYQCLYISAWDSSVHMDDDVGNEYAGGEVVFYNGHNNKLALNQRKRFRIAIPRMKDEADLVNIHFGLFSASIRSNQDCKGATSINNGYNFHKYDWSIAELRAE